MARAVWVGLGGFAGSVGRYWLSGAVQRCAGAGFPWGTAAVNVAGSFAIGLLYSMSIERGWFGTEARLFLMTGLCGGFTTMSTLSYETLLLWQDGQWLAAAVNLAGTSLLCLAAVWAGAIGGRWI